MDDLPNGSGQSDIDAALGAGTDVAVKIHPKWDDDLGEFVFAMGGKVRKDLRGAVRGHVISVEAGSERTMEFFLQGNELKFRSYDPFAAQPGLDCPEEATSLEEFRSTSSVADRLTVTNPGTQGVFSYALWLVDRNGDEHICDPIIKNIA